MSTDMRVESCKIKLASMIEEAKKNNSWNDLSMYDREFIEGVMSSNYLWGAELRLGNTTDEYSGLREELWRYDIYYVLYPCAIDPETPIAKFLELDKYFKARNTSSEHYLSPFCD